MTVPAPPAHPPRYRVEVADRHGAVALIIDAEPRLRPRQRGQLQALASGLVRDVAALLGCDEGFALRVALADLTRLVADEEAYARVAESRGLLPL